MKAIIIAAGPSSRLLPITNEKPKCLLEVGGKTIMQRQLETLRECGIDNIVVVRGYKGGMISFPDLRYYENEEYLNNNILRSLLYAESEMDDEFVFSYSDIIYEKTIVQKLLRSEADISLVIDVDWTSHYYKRYLHPIEEAELVMVEKDKLTKIGKRIVAPDKAHGEFIGLAKFTKKGGQILKANYRRAASQYYNRPFQQAASLEKAYLTDMIQELIDMGYVINNVDIKGEWMEIDTPEDLQKARMRFA